MELKSAMTSSRTVNNPFSPNQYACHILCYNFFFPWHSLLRFVPFARRRRRARVAAVPYDVVNTEEAHALANGNPLSFLHVSRAEIDLPPKPIPTRTTVYRKAVGELRGAEDAGAARGWRRLRALYVYRLRMGATYRPASRHASQLTSTTAA